MVLWGGLGAVIVLAAVVVIAFANFPADTSLSESGQAQSGGGSTSVAINLDDTLEDLDSTTASTSVSSDVLANGMSGLYRLDPNDQPVPDMAKGVKISDDELTYTFTLRDNIKWSNGEPVTSHDFKYAWLKVLNPDTASEYAYIIYTFVKGAAEYNAGDGSAGDVAIETPNDKTLKVTLVNPSPFWLGLTSHFTYYPQNQRFVEQQGEKYAQNADALIYNGPYIMTEFDPTQGVTLRKNTDYWDAENVDVRTVDAKIVRDGDTAVNLYESGELDVAGISGDHVTQYKGKPDFWSQTYFTTFYLVPNYDSKIFQNENIRRAFQMGFDSDSLVNKVLKDGSQAATGIVPVGIAGPGNQSFREAEGKTVPGYDPHQAKELFQRGVQEVGENPTIELLADDSSIGRDIATFLQSQFEKMGANIKVKVQPFNRKLELESNGEFQLSLQGWLADYDDPINFLELWESDSAFNTQRYSNPHYDQLIEDARTETDETKRMDMLLEAERILVKEDAAIAPTDFQGEAYLVRPSIKGFVDHKYGGGLDVRWWSLEE